MCSRKSLSAWLLLLPLLFMAAAETLAQAIPDDFQPVAKNEWLQLYARPSDGQLILHDLVHDQYWRSNPDTTKISGFMMLSDIWQGNLQSPVYVDYFDKRRNVRAANAYYGSPEIEFRLIPHGFACSYYFETTGIGFTVEYTLDQNTLLAVVPWDSVKIGNGELQLLALRILPFLGAVPSEADPHGYMIVPDGSGGLVRFKEQVALSQTGFNQWIYGLDPAAAEPVYDPYREPVVMPIFGIKAGSQALLGVVEQGQEAAKIIATPAGVITSLNWITAEFWYSQWIIMRTSRQGSGIRIFDENPIPGDRSVRFYFLAGEDANYVGMAKAYRSYLMEKQGARRISQEFGAPMLIEILGADYETNIFGPVIKAVTTFDQAGQIAAELLDHGVDQLILSYKGWNRMGIHGNLPRRLPPEAALGGSEGLRGLVDYLHQRGVRVLLQDDYTIARGANNGFQPSTQASRTTFNDLVKIRSLGFAVGAPDVTTYLISPKISLDYARRDIPQLAGFGVDGLVHLSIGSNLNSDHNPYLPEQTHRRDTRAIYSQLIELTREHFDLVGVNTGNAYLVGLVDLIAGVPMQATLDSFIDQSVPFYQIAVHGLIAYYAEPFNLSINPAKDLLRAVEYGALPSFTVSAEPSWNLRYTLSSYLYSTYFADWFEEIVEQYQNINRKMQLVSGKFIVDHKQLGANVYLTKYENGIHFVVNYGPDAYEYRGVMVAGNSFAVFDEEGLVQ